jgi:hypothetical protein
VQIIPRIEYCRSDHITIFISFIYAYKGLLMVSGTNNTGNIFLKTIFYSCLVLFLRGKQDMFKYQL